jgi:signal transduction histidine kinase
VGGEGERRAEWTRSQHDSAGSERIALLRARHDAYERAQELYERARAAHDQALSTWEASGGRDVMRVRERIALVTERERIAGDIHAGTIKMLFSIGMHLQSIASRNPDSEVVAELQGCIDDLDRAIAELRSYVFDLFPISDSSGAAQGQGWD